MGRIGRTEQVADVGDDPFVAGLDEPVVVEHRGVGFDALELSLDHREQGRSAPLFEIAVAQEGRQQPIEPLGHQQAHGFISVSVMPAGLISSSSAGSSVAEAGS